LPLFSFAMCPPWSYLSVRTLDATHVGRGPQRGACDTGSMTHDSVTPSNYAAAEQPADRLPTASHGQLRLPIEVETR
jgi:hypothetical protein